MKVTTDDFDQPTYQILSDDLMFLKGGAVWTLPTLLNGWSNFGGGWMPAGFRVVGDFVVLRGVISGGTVAATMFTLPAGARPTVGKCMFAAVANNAFARVDVVTTGEVGMPVGSNVFLSLDGIWIPLT